MSTPPLQIHKRDKFLNLFRSSSPEPKAKSDSANSKDIKRTTTAGPNTPTLHRLSIVSTDASIIDTSAASIQKSIEVENAITSTAVKRPDSSILPSTLQAKSHLDVLLKNVSPPAISVSLPEIRKRIDSTPQLALCIGLLPKDIDTSDLQENPSQIMSPDTPDRVAWINTVKQDTSEQNHIRWLGVRMVDEFVKDTFKDSTEISEIVLLGPVLGNETYRRLLQHIISSFDQFALLDVDLLQGMVQLIQSAPPGSLLPDDLVKILSILRVRLQGIHQQSSVHPFYLTLAVSRVLDVMADHKVKDLNKVVEHEPLSEVLSGLKESSDPYLMYQACYAFQALQYVPDDETALQVLLRHSTGVADGLVKVSAVFKLDVGAVLEGLENLQEVLGSAVRTAAAVYEGTCSLMESGQGVLSSLKERLGSGQKRPWYVAIRAANTLSQAGQLKDLNRLIYEAPCRRDPLFQWGICQLLGEIASDAVWDTTVRQQAIDVIGELYKNDDEWGQDESVNAWMLKVIGQLCSVDDKAVSTAALTLLKEVKQDIGTTSGVSYPLRNRPPLPTSSPILARVQNIPNVEYDLHLHKIQQLNQSTRSIYIPPLAKTSLNAKDDDLFPLMEKVQEFLKSERQVMLVLGDSGAGKSTFNRHLEHQLWTNYQKGGAIPLFIDLPGIDRPDQDLIAKQLKIYNFKDDQIQELKLHRQLILICDGYDESQQLVNLHKANMLNQPGQWNTKMIVSCRTQFLGPTYLDRFKPQPLDRYNFGSQDLFQEAVIAPFSKDQVKSYVDQYAQDPQTAALIRDQAAWSADEYMDKLATIPNVMDLVKNPFLLTLALKALPGLVASNKDLTSIRVTRARLYDMFIDQWLETNQLRLQSSTLKDNEQEALNALMDDNFIAQGIDYLLRLSTSIFDEQEGNPIVKYIQRVDKDSWKAAFFGSEPEVKLLRESSPLMRTGNQYRFIHRSVLEYLFSRVIYNPSRIVDEFDPPTETGTLAFQPLDADGPLFQRDLLQEPSVVQFLCDRVRLSPIFEHQLRTIIEQSKTDSSATKAATNAITILIGAGVTFNGADLRGVRIPGADLFDGQFDSAQFQGADLRGANLTRSWLRQADFSGASMEGVTFGELPYLAANCNVMACCFSPNGKMLGVAGYDDFVYIYDTSTWTTIHCLRGHEGYVNSIVFSPDSQQLVSGGRDHTLRLWDTTSGEELLWMEGHGDRIASVAFSPCGSQIASASDDNTLRLWDAQSGECLFVLEGHTSPVKSVKYSPDGRKVVSGSWDETIQFWDSQTGEPGDVLSPSCSYVQCAVYSHDGRWVATGHWKGHLQLWDANTLQPGPVLSGHTETVTGIDFSLNGQWIASSSDDRTVRLWDALTGTLISIMTGHSDYVSDLSFSPDGLCIASAGLDDKVRLWEVNSCWSSSEQQDQTLLVWDVMYSADGRKVLSCSNGVVQQWDSRTGVRGPVLLKLPQAEARFFMTFLPDGRRVLVGEQINGGYLWSLQDGGAGTDLSGLFGWEDTTVYSPCGHWIVSLLNDGTVQLWDLYNLRQGDLLSAATGEPAKDHATSAVFSPSSRHFAIGYKNGTVRIFDPHTRDILITKSLVKNESVSLLTFSPSGRQLAMGTDSNFIYLWDLHSERPSIELEIQGDYARSIAYSTCGEWIASVSADNTIRIWHRRQDAVDESWSSATILQGFFGPIRKISWNPVVPLEFATCCDDGSVRVWRIWLDNDIVTVNMLWGTNVQMLCAAGMILGNATGLSLTQQQLLLQRGATDSTLVSEQQESDIEE